MLADLHTISVQALGLGNINSSLVHVSVTPSIVSSQRRDKEQTTATSEKYSFKRLVKTVNIILGNLTGVVFIGTVLVIAFKMFLLQIFGLLQYVSICIFAFHYKIFTKKHDAQGLSAQWDFNFVLFYSLWLIMIMILPSKVHIVEDLRTIMMMSCHLKPETSL